MTWNVNRRTDVADLPPPLPERETLTLPQLLREIIRRFPDAERLVLRTKKQIEAEVRSRDEAADQASRCLEQDLRAERARLRRVGIGLLTGGLNLPPRTGRSRPAHLLVQDFFNLRNQEFLSLAQLMHEQLGQHSAVGWQIVLTDGLFQTGLPGFFHRLLQRRFPASPVEEAEEARLLYEQRDETLVGLRERITRETATGVEAGIAFLLETVVAKTLLLVWDLLTTAPPGWLLLPSPGDPFDPAQHQGIPGRPTVNARVTGLIFPGYQLRNAPDKVVEKALVYTSSIPPPTAGDSGRPPPGTPE